MKIRRVLLLVLILSATFIGCTTSEPNKENKPQMEISLAEWSLHRELWAKNIDHLDFARISSQRFGIKQVEYVSQFFQDKAENFEYLQQMKDSCKKYGVKSHLIMIDGEGELGEPDSTKRTAAVAAHRKWIKAAAFLGCKSIRVNASGIGSDELVAKSAVVSLRELSGFASKYGINVIVENHGMMVNGQWKHDAPSTNGKWLSAVLKEVDLPNCGALPDFGNFASYDRYQGVKDLLPYAKGISAKALDFDEAGNEVHTDFKKMMAMIASSGFTGIVGIEYEGDDKNGLSEYEGIQKTLDLLKRVLAEK